MPAGRIFEMDVASDEDQRRSNVRHDVVRTLNRGVERTGGSKAKFYSVNWIMSERVHEPMEVGGVILGTGLVCGLGSRRTVSSVLGYLGWPRE